MQETWQKVIQIIKERVSRPSFETWIKNLEVTQEDNNWTIIALNEFAKDWVENKYRSLIVDAIEKVTGETPVVLITTKDFGDISPPSSSIDSILRQIHQLRLSEKNKLFDTLNKEMNDEHARAESQEVSGAFVGKEQEYDTDRMTRLELEVTELKRQLQEIRDKIGDKLV